MADDALLAEQVEYYRARAGEYDRWWNREGRYDRGPEANAKWFAEAAELERVLEGFDPRGDVLELACGTGLWTRHLVHSATTLTAVDAAEEVLEINRSRVGDERIRYVQADLFNWTPDRPGGYDACVFAFWLSHVPEERFAEFWEVVSSALRPGGRVLFIDSARAERSKAADHVMPEAGDPTESRRLDDGREFRIVKRYYDEGLESEMQRLGWDCRLGSTGEFFIYGVATRRP